MGHERCRKWRYGHPCPLLYVRGRGQRRGAGSAQIPLRGISSYSAIITTVDSSWRIRRARAQLWRNHNGTSSTPRAELRVEHKLGGLASDNVLFEYLGWIDRTGHVRVNGMLSCRMRARFHKFWFTINRTGIHSATRDVSLTLIAFWYMNFLNWRWFFPRQKRRWNFSRVYAHDRLNFDPREADNNNKIYRAEFNLKRRYVEQNFNLARVAWNYENVRYLLHDQSV